MFFRRNAQRENIVNGFRCFTPEVADSVMATDGSSTISFLSLASEDSDTLTVSSQYSTCWSPTSSMLERSVSQQDSVRSDRSPTLSPQTTRKKVYADGQYI